MLIVGENYKKVRPTNYTGPGHYKPLLTPKKPRRRWHPHSAQTQDDTQELGVLELILESPKNLLHESIVQILPDVVPRTTLDAWYYQRKPNLNIMYFTIPTLRLSLNYTVMPQSNLITDTALYYAGNNTEYEKFDANLEKPVAKNIKVVAEVDKFNIRSQTNNVSNETKETKEIKPIIVNVTKTRDTAPPFVLKTMMYKNQLMK